MANGIGNVFTCIGASNHTVNVRDILDFYATEPKATELLLKEETFNNNIWECACGMGHMANPLKEHGYNVRCSDIINRGYEGTEVIDFLKCNDKFDGDIITNPPYKYAKEFVEKAMELTSNKVAMFLKLTFLESKVRRQLFDRYPPKVVYVSSSRLQCAKGGNFTKYNKSSGTAVAYAWFIWDKSYTGDTILKWI